MTHPAAGRSWTRLSLPGLQHARYSSYPERSDIPTLTSSYQAAAPLPQLSANNISGYKANQYIRFLLLLPISTQNITIPSNPRIKPTHYHFNLINCTNTLAHKGAPIFICRHYNNQNHQVFNRKYQQSSLNAYK